jgi:hypothetical protein
LKKIRCEGWRRYGAFQLGGTGWNQCKSNSTVTAEFTNPGEKPKRLPSCDHCLKEAQTTTGMKVSKIKPIK